MEQPSEDTFREIQALLEPYIRPREEVARIRQTLAIHLDSCLQLEDGAAVGPLSLVDANIEPSSASAARGLQKQYLEALNANIRARDEFAACCREQRRSDENEAASSDKAQNHLQAHLEAIQIRQRRDKLQAVERALGALGQKPAASPGFLDPREIFRDSRPLPDIPKSLVTAITVDRTTVGPQLKDLIDQLERHVLQAQLLLRREERLLEKVRSRSTARPENISAGAKLEALNNTRAELINWMETELGKAANDDGDAEGQDAQRHRGAPSESVNMDEQLASISEKYAQYLDARKTLLQLVSQQPLPVMAPPAKETKLPPPTSSPASQAPPTAHLLVPHLEKLLLTAREQKGLISQKSHLSAAVTKQLKENTQVLNHLAEESQLVPAHPMPGAPRSTAAFADAISAADNSGPSGRVKPWVFAADSAKIATLEAVAEKIEEGQIALEGSVRALGEIDQLLGRSPPVEKGSDEQTVTAEEDVWLAEGRSPGRTTAGARKHTGRTVQETAQPKTVWDMLDGNLGLLRSNRNSLM